MVLCGIESQYPDLTSASRRISICHSIRKDGVWTDVPENSSALEKLHANPAAFAIFSYNSLDQNSEPLSVATINDIAPNFENIADGSYPIGRKLYVYIKQNYVV